MAITKYHVDGRMLHGQTCTAFGRVYNIDEFVVINEKTSKDPMQITLLQLASMGTPVTICSPAEAKDIFENNELVGSRTMVVFKNIEDASEIVNLGYQIDELSIGGMFAEKGRDRVQKAICLFVDDEDKKHFKMLADKNVKITHQVVPEYKASLLKDLVDF